MKAPALIIGAADSLNAPAAGQWQRLLSSGPASVLKVAGDHYAFLRPPLVTRVGAAIREWQEEHPDDI